MHFRKVFGRYFTVFYLEAINVLNIKNCFLITGVTPAGVTEVIFLDIRIRAITWSGRRSRVISGGGRWYLDGGEFVRGGGLWGAEVSVTMRLVDHSHLSLYSD